MLVIGLVVVVSVDGRSVDGEDVELLDDVTLVGLFVDVSVVGLSVDVEGAGLLDDGVDDTLVSV